MVVNEAGRQYSFEQHRLVGFYDTDDDQFWRSLEDGTFTLPRCVGCGRWRWESVRAIFGSSIDRCGDCGTWDKNWVEVPLAGTIFGWARTNQVFAGVDERRGDIPYVSIEVTVAEQPGGPRVAGILVGDATGLRVGAAVTGTILPPGEKSKWYPSLAWQLVPADSTDETPKG
jgi:uncharacterized OB-fold protein